MIAFFVFISIQLNHFVRMKNIVLFQIKKHKMDRLKTLTRNKNIFFFNYYNRKTEMRFEKKRKENLYLNFQRQRSNYCITDGSRI